MAKFVTIKACEEGTFFFKDLFIYWGVQREREAQRENLQADYVISKEPKVGLYPMMHETIT